MTPRLKFLSILLASAPLVAASAAEPVSEGGRKFSTVMTGANEVTAAGVPNQGDPDGRGTADITVNVGQQRVCWDIDVTGIAPPTRGHIHHAPSTTTGPIVVGFFEASDVDLNGCTTSPVDRELLRDILQNPADYYVNVHNADFPAGALRGQLSK